MVTRRRQADVVLPFGELNGPNLGPAEIHDEFHAWAAVVIRRVDLATSDWWKRELRYPDGSARRLQAEIARALRQAAAGGVVDPLAGVFCDEPNGGAGGRGSAVPPVQLGTEPDLGAAGTAGRGEGDAEV